MAAIDKVQETTSMDLATLLEAGDGAVVTFVAGETRLAVHRAVLEARSPVFAAMFRHDTLESSSGQVSVTDVEGVVLRQLLSYCYTLQAPQIPGMAPQLLAAADKYELLSLKAACEGHLAAQLAMENAAAAAVLAVRHSSPNLTAAAVAFIKANSQVLATQGWADAVHTQPEAVVQVCRLLAEQPAEARTISGEASGCRLVKAALVETGEKLRALLRAGLDRVEYCLFRRTSLHCAADRGDVVAVKRLMEGGSEVDPCDRWQNTPLHLAAVKGHTAVVRLLATYSANPNAMNAWGSTPLHYTAYWGRTETAAALLEAGADKQAIDGWGKTPLDEARQNNKQQLLELLT